MVLGDLPCLGFGVAFAGREEVLYVGLAAGDNNIAKMNDDLFLVDLHVIGINVGLGVHSPLSVVLSGEDRFMGSSLSAVVGGLSFGDSLPDFEVLNEEKGVSTMVGTMFLDPAHDG